MRLRRDEEERVEDTESRRPGFMSTTPAEYLIFKTSTTLTVMRTEKDSHLSCCS
jgi:hypothetical protein